VTKKKHKVFSLHQANSLLPDLEKRLRHLQNKKEAYSRTHDSLFMHELICAAERSKGLVEEQDDLEMGIHALEDAIEELAKDVEAIFASGSILRNIEKGQVEFLGEHDGETVYFSWELGEPEITYYRTLHSPRHERRTLPGKSAKEKAK